MPTVRTRFAPSPTGLLHVGGVRTALFAWLHARHNGGTFVLRIEDTDETREHREAIEQIQSALRWIGLDWDEGPGVGGPHAPYVQSERRPRHLSVAADLLERRLAYRCYCTPAELEVEREQAKASGLPMRYSRRCLARSADELAALAAAGTPSVIRLRTPDEGACEIVDLVRGEVRFEYAQLGDHVIVRSGGVPTYNFVNPIDDADMQITDVIRGEDLLSSTPRQVLIYEALGAPVPRFGHLPLLFGPDRKRLSKRHGATSVEEYRDAGYLPEAMLNFLALLGWRFDDKQELFTRDELVRLFEVERVSSSSAIFDGEKLAWLNGIYLRGLAPEDLAQRIIAFLRATGSPIADAPERVGACVPLVQQKIATLAEFEPYCAFLFGEIELDPAAWSRIAADERAGELLEGASAVLAEVTWTIEAIEAALRGACEQLGVKPKALFGAIRVAITGRSVAPGLFESIELLGRDATLARLASARALIS